MIFITHSSAERELFLGDKVISRLRALGEVRLNTTNAPLPTSELIHLAAGCKVVVADSRTPGERRLFEGVDGLVAFVRGHVDIRNVDVQAASDNGVLVVQASAGYGPAVSELVVGMMIDLARGVTSATMSYRMNKEPARRVGRQLSESTIGVIGYGHIGIRLCNVALAIGMRVLVCDPHVSLDPDAGVEQVPLQELLEEADFVVPLAPATMSTANLLDGKSLARMKSTAFLINVSRGELIDEGALESALAAEQLAGAALDVGTAEGQMPPLRLARRVDVIATPHVGGLTESALRHQALELVDHVTDILAGRRPRGAVNA